MPTENRRVATYLPKNIDERLQSFKAEHNIRGDSQALIVILSKFFEVEQSVAQGIDYSGFAKTPYFLELLDKINNLSDRVNESSSISSSLSRLPNRIEQLEERLEKLESALMSAPLHKAIPAIPSIPVTTSEQIDLLIPPEKPVQEIQSESPVRQSEPVSEGNMQFLQSIRPLNGNQLSKRFGLAKDSVAGSKRSRTPEAFLQWTKEKDPDGITWQFNLHDKLYHPISSE